MALQFIGNETRVNSTTAGNQRAVSTTALQNGGYVTVWASDSGDGSGKAIMGQLFAADGSKVGSEFLINTTTAGDQDLPQVVSMPLAPTDPNVFFVVWQSAEAGGSVIRARRFLEDGTPIRFLQSDVSSPTTDVVVSGTFGGSKPAAGLYGSGRLAFVWEAPSGDGSGTAIVMAQYRFFLSAPVVVNTTTAGNQVDPQVGARAGGGLGIVWESQEPAGDVIRGRIILPAGTPATDTVVSDGVGEDESLPNFALNGALAIWNAGTSIKAAALPFSGGAQPSVVLNTTPGGVVSRSDIIALADGTYLAVYFTQSGDDGSSYSLRVERFDSSGQSLSPEILVPDKFTGVQEGPSVVQLANGNVVISWASEADELGNFEIKQRLLNLNGPEEGDSGDNTLNGTMNPDVFILHHGGNDTANGLGGNDVFIFRAALNSQDKVDGGDGRDQIVIQGDYTGANALTLGTGVVNVETFALIPGNDTRQGDPGTNSYSYHVTTVNENIAAGQVMTFDAAQLRVGENFTFRGAAETDGTARVIGGLGIDDFIGGSQTDVFLFNDGAFGSSDVVNGGAGTARDQLALRGDYAIAFGAGQLTSIESLAILSGFDVPQQTDYDYTIIMHDNNLVGGSMTVDAAQLRASETFVFFGDNETDGFFRISGGAGDDQIIGGRLGDRIRGNGGNDSIYGHLGADELYGGAGNDRFAYDSTTHSNAAATDKIMDFTTGDLIALDTIDANSITPGNDAFQFIGSAAFTLGTPGQLRAFEDPARAGHWYVLGDVNGDAQADLVIEVYTTDLQPLDASDFTL